MTNVEVLREVLPPGVPVHELGEDGADELVSVGGDTLRLRRLARGWPRQVRDALVRRPPPDVLVAQVMSPGARAACSAAGVGWADETGAAEIATGLIVVSRSGTKPAPRSQPGNWTPAVLSVVEAVLTGTKATVAAVVERTGLSTGAAVKALRVLADEGYLRAAATRGPRSARGIADPDRLLDRYAERVAAQRPRSDLRVGVVWREPVAEAAQLGATWEAVGTRWAATGALAAAVLAPAQTLVSPWEIYVEAAGIAELRAVARDAGLRAVDGGRLRLRPFPSPATATLSAAMGAGLKCVPWPRVYADLRSVGVRGEDVAEHLREEMSRGQ